MEQNTPRPGDRLHQLLYDRLGVDIRNGCQCQVWIDLMNHWGSIGCRKHLGRIINVLIAEADRRHWELDGRPLLSIVARVGARVPWGRAYAYRWVRRLILEVIVECEQP